MSQTINPSTEDVRYTIQTDDCISCAACVSMAPSIFQMEEDGPARNLKARIIKQPSTLEEIREVEEAAATCPAQAILRA
jgi:ferredoxin